MAAAATPWQPGSSEIREVRLRYHGKDKAQPPASSDYGSAILNKFSVTRNLELTLVFNNNRVHDS